MVMNVGFEGTYDTGGINFPWVMKEGGTYKVWYSGYDGSNYRIIYATSPDGQTWTSQGMIIDHGPPDSPDAINVIEITIAKDPQGLYNAWYNGMNATASSLLNATSLDGVTWNKQGISMEGLPGTRELSVGSGSVMISSSSAFALWYIGLDSSSIFRIFLANYSKNGHIVSEPIGPFTNCDWGTFFANKTDPSADVFVTFSILDGADWTNISGYSNLTASVIDLSPINRTIHPTIRLRADLWDLVNNPVNTPWLHDWTATYVDLDDPIFDGLISAVDDQTGGNVTLTWDLASDVSTPVIYNVYMATMSMGQNFGTPDYTTLSVGMQVTGLTNGVTYFFIVRAQDAVGHEENNTMERGAMPTTPTDSTPPDFQGLVTASDTGTGGTVDLFWGNASDPDTVECNSDPSLPITYNVYYSTTSFGQNFALPDAITQNTNIQTSGLNDGVDYYFIVRAMDAVGNEDQNIAERIVRPTTSLDSTTPDFFGLVAASDTGAGGKVDLSWASATDPDTLQSSSDPSLPIQYNVYLSTTSGGQNFLIPDATTLNTSIQIGGLQDGVDYFFVVRAEDAVGNEEQNLVERSATPTTPDDSTPPDFAGLASATDGLTGGSVTLTWSDATDPDTIESNTDPSLPVMYNVYVSQTSGGQDFLTPDRTTLDNQIAITGLEDGVVCYFVVRAVDGAGNEEQNAVEMSATPTTPVDTTPPTFDGLVNATDLGTSGDVYLGWSAATDPDTVECNSDPSMPLSYNIYVSTVPGGQNFLTPDQTVTGTQAQVTGLQNGMTFYFVVRAQDATGNEEQNTVEMPAMPTTSVDTSPPTFGGLSFVVADDKEGVILLTWNPASDPDDPECNSDPSDPIMYSIYISESPTEFDLEGPANTTKGVNHVFETLERGVTYYFIVRAEDDAGNMETNTISKPGELEVKEKPFDLFEYLWMILLIIIVVLLVALALLARKKKEEQLELKEEKEDIEEEKDEETVDEE
jgi:hypothetical protein